MSYNTELRISTELLDFIRNDLARSHEFAWERVGFLFCKAACEGSLLLASSYQSVADEHYLPDRFVGARFDGAAIRSARQYSMESGDAILHVHAHEGSGKPYFSKTDLKCLLEMVPSFVSVSPKVPHGAVILSDNGASGILWRRDKPIQEIDEIRAVGFYSKILNRESYGQPEI